MLGAGVRAAVEVQAQVGDLRRRSARRGGRSARPRRVFVSATEKLQCGSPVQAIELPRTGLMSSGKPIASSSACDLVDFVVRDAGDDEVLLARQADVAAEAVGEVGDRDHLVAGDQPEVDRDADVGEPVLLLGVDAEVVRRLDVDRAAASSPRACGRAAPRPARGSPRGRCRRP